MDIDTTWEKIKKGVREGAAISIEKIEEYSKIGKLKVEEFATKKKIDRNFIDIGERLFELVEDGKHPEGASDMAIKKAVSDIRSHKEELISIEKKIKAILEESKKSKNKTEDVDDASGV
jgi:cytochrome c